MGTTIGVLKHLRWGRFAQRLMSAYKLIFNTFRYHRPWAPQTLVFSGRILRHPSGPLHQLLSFHSRTSKLPQNGVTVCLPRSLDEEQDNLMTHTVTLPDLTLDVASADLFHEVA